MIKTIHIDHHVVAKYKQATRIGVIGALLMVTYLVIIELITGGNSYGWKFMKYLFFAIPMAFGLCKMSEGEGFHNPYLPQSTFYTAIIATTAAIVMVIAYWITIPVKGIDLATISTTVVEHNQLNSNAQVLPLPIPCMLFLEVFAMGMIIGFALLVYGTDIKHIKRKSKSINYKTTIKKVV